MHEVFHYNTVRFALPALTGFFLTLFTIPFMPLQAQYTHQPDSPGSPATVLLPPSCSFLPELRIGLISDPQYGDLDPMGTRFYRESLRKLDEAVDTFNARMVDFVMTLGDMTDRYYESFDSVKPRYGRLDAPDYALLGNHEFEQVPDSLKHNLVARYGMPDYYYDFVYKGWQFLVLDATELGAYARVLHPELAAEGDSLWRHVEGRVNAHEWNGGISRSQLQWIRQKLTASYEKSIPVVIFCHHQVYPFNLSENLWNDTAVADLVSQFPHVAAFINGHNHKGDYGFYRGVHFLTLHAMVETKDTNSYSLLTFYPDRIEVEGHGLNSNRIWPLNRVDTLSRFLHLSNAIIKTSDSTGSCIGTLSLRRNDDLYEQAAFQVDRDTLDGQLFSVSGDTLFLQTNENLSGKGLLQVRIHAVNCLRQQVSHNFSLVFDSITIFLHRPLPDTVADVNQESLTLPVDQVFSDSSRHGITFVACTGNPEKATAWIENGNLVCQPRQLGETSVFVTALDPFTGFSLTDTLLLNIRRIFNQTPFPTCTADTLCFTTGRDTIVMLPDTMFADPDGDTLSYGIVSADPQTALARADAGKFVLIAAGKGETEIIITASDPYGGESHLIYPVIVRETLTLSTHSFSRHHFEGKYDPLHHEIVVYAPTEKKEVQIMMTGMDGNRCELRFRAVLSAGANHFPMTALLPPGGYVLVIRQGNIILHTQKILITPVKH